MRAFPSHLRPFLVAPAEALVRGSTPVFSFGDEQSARVATLGINPSKAEFLDRSGAMLPSSERRLATLDSVGVSSDSLAQTLSNDDEAARESFLDFGRLTDEQLALIVGDCRAYFRPERNPYWRWFRPLERLIETAVGASYSAGNACHLDLTWWATDPVWSRLSRSTRDRLLRDAHEMLPTFLHQTSIRLLLLNGRTVVDLVRSQGLSKLRKHTQIPLGQHSTCSLFVGTLNQPQCARPQAAQAIHVVGWSTNLQSSFGVSNAFKAELAAAVRTLVPTQLIQQMKQPPQEPK